MTPVRIEYCKPFNSWADLIKVNSLTPPPCSHCFAVKTRREPRNPRPRPKKVIRSALLRKAQVWLRHSSLSKLYQILIKLWLQKETLRPPEKSVRPPANFNRP